MSNANNFSDLKFGSFRLTECFAFGFGFKNPTNEFLILSRISSEALCNSHGRSMTASTLFFTGHLSKLLSPVSLNFTEPKRFLWAFGLRPVIRSHIEVRGNCSWIRTCNLQGIFHQTSLDSMQWQRLESGQAHPLRVQPCTKSAQHFECLICFFHSFNHQQIRTNTEGRAAMSCVLFRSEEEPLTSSKV